VILDTNALSAWAEQDEALLAVLPASHLLMLPVIVIGEYRYGIRRSRWQRELESWLDSAIRAVRVLPVTLETTESYAAVRTMLHQKGRPISANDIWIAALAVQLRLPVLSRDAHFDVVDHLTRVSW
jgi:predicted nucleic acid-binding protein